MPLGIFSWGETKSLIVTGALRVSRISFVALDIVYILPSVRSKRPIGVSDIIKFRITKMPRLIAEAVANTDFALGRSLDSSQNEFKTRKITVPVKKYKTSRKSTTPFWKVSKCCVIAIELLKKDPNPGNHPSMEVTIKSVPRRNSEKHATMARIKDTI